MESQNLFLYLQMLPASVRLIISKKGLWLRLGSFDFILPTNIRKEVSSNLGTAVKIWGM